MSQVSFKGNVLEINRRPAKDNPDKIYSTLIMYEPGKKYPELVKISLMPDQIDLAAPAVGKVATVVAEMSVFQDRVSFQFRGFGQ